jgi:hypothetical protein
MPNNINAQWREAFENWRYSQNRIGNIICEEIIEADRESADYKKQFLAWRAGYEIGRDTFHTLQLCRKSVITELHSKGFLPAEECKSDEDVNTKCLQWLWRQPGCRRNPNEIMLAILDALTQEGIAAWCGDATSCVEQIVRTQYERAEKKNVLS